MDAQKWKMQVISNMQITTRVQLLYAVSNNFLGHEVRMPSWCLWEDFLVALHVYAARVLGVPMRCIQLTWDFNPWEQQQLPSKIFASCLVTNVLPPGSWAFQLRSEQDPFCLDSVCGNCLEDCEDIYYCSESKRRFNCGNCGTSCLCDRCRVHLSDGTSRCLLCLVDEQRQDEVDAVYQARLDAILDLLDPLQRRRWHSVAIMDEQGLGSLIHR